MLRPLLFAFLATTALACTIVTEVLPLGKDTYAVTGTSSLGLGEAQEIAIRKAEEFAADKGLKVAPVRFDTGTDSGGDRYTLTFRLVTEDDPEWRRGEWPIVPDTVIQDARGAHETWEDRLMKLHALKESGALTEEEFATLKASLLKKASR